MVELTDGMWKFKGKNFAHPSTVYLRDDEIVGAIVDDARMVDPQLVLLTRSSGAININWAEHHKSIVDYIEGAENAGETYEEP